MATSLVWNRSRGLGMASLALAFLGLVFFWWVPFGMVLSLAGLILGVVGWFLAAGPARSLSLVIAGMLLSLVAVGINLVVASTNTEMLRLTFFH